MAQLTFTGTHSGEFRAPVSGNKVDVNEIEIFEFSGNKISAYSGRPTAQHW